MLLSRAMKKLLKVISFLFVSAGYLLLPTTAYAVCPICTAAVIGGLGLSRYLGIDDAVSGIWVGGLILSLSFWMTDWIKRKGWLKKFNDNLILASVFVSLYLITFVPMQLTNFIGHPANKIYGIDKLIFGSVIGLVVFLFGVYADRKERQIKGKQLFEFQRVVFPVLSLLIASVILYLIIKK